MKKVLLLIIAACAMTLANAQKITFKSCNEHPIEQLLEQGRAHIRPAAPAKANQALITPEGNMTYYTLSAVVRDLSGLMPVMNVAETVYFSSDNKSVFFGSLFPSILKCEDLWVEGQLKANEVVFDCYDEVFYLEECDPDGTITYSAALQMGELLVDAYGNPYGMEDVRFTRDGNRFYIDYSDVDLRPLVLFVVNDDETVSIVTTAYNHDLRPYEGNTTLNVVPATATVSDYIYSGQDSSGKEFSIKGSVAIDGNDYYFDSLLPEAGHAWIKGTRSGNTITLDNNQFLGSEISYYLYYNGFKTTGFDSSTGQYLGDKTKLTFSVDSKGVITLNSPSRTFPCAFFTSGNQFYATFQNRIEPFQGDQVARPSDPYNLKLVTKYFAAYGENTIGFNLDNVSADGDYLNPELLYYCMYLDEDLYTFERSIYPYIHEETMTHFPFGYRDKGNYDIYLADDGVNVICFREDMFVQCGIQAVYRLDGKEYLSNIVYVDEKGNVEKVDPYAGLQDGVKKIEIHPAQNGSWYDLAGRRKSTQGSGIAVKNGRVVIR